MTQRVRPDNPVFNHHPFTGSGTSLYVSQSSTIQYRNLRVIPRHKNKRRRNIIVKGSGGNHDIANSITKTGRKTSVFDPTTSIPWSIPSSFWNGDVWFDIRRFENNVESEVSNYRTEKINLDVNGNTNNKIEGTGNVFDRQIRAAGIVRILFRYNASRSGIQPTQFRITRTAGPSSPVDVTVPFVSGKETYAINTPTLLDSSAYTYSLIAENGAVTKNLVVGLSVQADATGPPQPTAGTTEPY